MATSLLLTACVKPVAFGTETKLVWCRALNDTFPIASIDDTEETLDMIAEHGVVVDALCAEFY